MVSIAPSYAAATAGGRAPGVSGTINYLGAMSVRPRFHANDAQRDVLKLEPHTVWIEDARRRLPAAALMEEGFTLVPHASAVRDFRDSAEVARVHPAEIEHLIAEVSGADAVVVTGPGILRFGERSADCGRFNNSRPARFIHIDASAATAHAFERRHRPTQLAGGVRRFAQYNIWRVLTPPPQDVPLAVCSARSIAAADLVPADAVFDIAGQPEWSFESLLLRYAARHRWSYYSNMTREEALVFKTFDSDPSQPSQVAHSAFDDAACPAQVPPRTSIEMRAIAYWRE